MWSRNCDYHADTIYSIRMSHERKPILVHATLAAAVFSEPQYSPKLAEALAREAGVPVRMLDPVATGSPGRTAYEDAMRRNLSTLKEALSDR